MTLEECFNGCLLEIPNEVPTAKLSVLLPHANRNAYHSIDINQAPTMIHYITYPILFLPPSKVSLLPTLLACHIIYIFIYIKLPLRSTSLKIKLLPAQYSSHAKARCAPSSRRGASFGQNLLRYLSLSRAKKCSLNGTHLTFYMF